jgi:hypothetical protein
MLGGGEVVETTYLLSADPLVRAELEETPEEGQRLIGCGGIDVREGASRVEADVSSHSTYSAR